LQTFAAVGADVRYADNAAVRCRAAQRGPNNDRFAGLSGYLEDWIKTAPVDQCIPVDLE
jgi:hypothetical protein